MASGAPGLELAYSSGAAATGALSGCACTQPQQSLLWWVNRPACALPAHTSVLLISLLPAHTQVARCRGDEAYDTEKADVWSCGVTLYCMLAGRYPFMDTDHQVRCAGGGRVGCAALAGHCSGLRWLPTCMALPSLGWPCMHPAL